MRTDIYTRLSQYQPDQTSTARQERDCRSLADSRDWTIDTVHTDVDVSAYSGVERPAFNELCDRVRARETDAVVFWKIDRLARNTREFLGFVDLCEHHGVTLASVNEPFDTSSPIGRVIVTILAAFAELESATIGIRVRSARDLEARQGRPHVGGRRRFGYNRDMTPRPDEAAAIQRAAREVLTGSSFYAIAQRWNAEGPHKDDGNPWTVRLVSRTLRQPHMAALRVHNGDVTEGTWDAILDRATHEALNANVRPRRRRAHRTFLLSGGILVCGVCGADLIGSTGRYRTYTCPVGPGRTGRGCVSITAEKAEATVSEAVLGALDEIRGQLPRTGSQRPSDAILAALRDAERRVEELGEDYAEGLISRATMRAGSARLQAEIDRLSRELAETAATGPLSGPDPVAEWGARDIEWRHNVAAAIFDRVEVLPAGRGARTPARDRLKFFLRTG